LSLAAGGVHIAVRLAPRSRAERIDGIVRLADGTTALKASVTAPPEGGRANAALLRLLAKRLRLPQRDLVITAGLRSRSKTVHIAGDPDALVRRLRAAVAEDVR
jgi:uncharacterized protein (TIGR00251 family)